MTRPLPGVVGHPVPGIWADIRGQGGDDPRPVDRRSLDDSARRTRRARMRHSARVTGRWRGRKRSHDAAHQRSAAIRLMPEYSAPPLWTGRGPVTPQELGLSRALCADILAWAAEWEFGRGEESSEDEFVKRGETLARRAQEELGHQVVMTLGGEITLMPEYGVDVPLWPRSAETDAMVPPDVLLRLIRWQERFDESFHWERGWSDRDAEADWAAEGKTLEDLLRKALPPGVGLIVDLWPLSAR